MQSRDPSTNVVLLEDAAAVVGVTLAAGCMGLTSLTGEQMHMETLPSSLLFPRLLSSRLSLSLLKCEEETQREDPRHQAFNTMRRRCFRAVFRRQSVQYAVTQPHHLSIVYIAHCYILYLSDEHELFMTIYMLTFNSI